MQFSFYILLSYQDFAHPRYSCVDDGEHNYLPNVNGYNHLQNLNVYCLWLTVMSHYRRVVIILEIEVIKPAKDVAGRIGDPTPFAEGKPSNHIS